MSARPPDLDFWTGRTARGGVRAAEHCPISILQAHGGGALPRLALWTTERFVRFSSTLAVDLPRRYKTAPRPRVKVNGLLGTPFPNTSGVKLQRAAPSQGYSTGTGTRLEVQLRMIRNDTTRAFAIRGIPRSQARTEASPHRPWSACRRRGAHALKERGLVDDTMIAPSPPETPSCPYSGS